MLAPVVGSFAEMSSDVHLLTDLIASAQAADHCEYFAAPEPAWGSTKASAQDDKAMDAHHYHHPPSGFNAGFAR